MKRSAFLKRGAVGLVGSFVLSKPVLGVEKVFATSNSRYATLRQTLRNSDPDHAIFRPESWVYLDPGKAWETEDGLYTPSVARESRQTVHATETCGRKKSRYIRTSEDTGLGLHNFQMNWSKLIVINFRVGLHIQSYFNARLTLGKSNLVGFGPIPPNMQGIGFLLQQGGTLPHTCYGLAHAGGSLVNGLESVLVAIPPPSGVNYYSTNYTLTAVSFGDGATEFLVNGISVAYVATGGPSGYLPNPLYLGCGVRIEMVNDDGWDDPGFVNKSEIAFHGASVYVNE